MLGKTGPEVIAHRPPILLKEGRKLGLLEPQQAKVSMVVKGML
jgi:hypothetical protein